MNPQRMSRVGEPALVRPRLRNLMSPALQAPLSNAVMVVITIILRLVRQMNFNNVIKNSCLSRLTRGQNGGALSSSGAFMPQPFQILAAPAARQPAPLAKKHPTAWPAPSHAVP